MSETLTLLTRRIGGLLAYLRPGTWRARKARNQRGQWDGQARWYRLRYDDAGKATTMVNRLGKAAGKRVGLRFRYINRTTLQCYLAVAPKFAAVAEEMAASFSCRLIPGDPPDPLPGLFYAGSLPHDFMAADAYVVDGEMYVLPIYGMTGNATSSNLADSDDGLFFPVAGHRATQTAAAMEAITGAASLAGGRLAWSLPAPSLGTAIRITLSLTTPTPLLRREHEWLVGWDSHGRSVGAYQAGVMGQPDAVTDWLMGLVLSACQNNDRNIVLIDGRGDLTDALTARPYMTRLINAQRVHLLDVKRSLQAAFNPLALVLSDDPQTQAEKTAVRWHWWFGGMSGGVTRELMAAAFTAGVRTLPDFYQWTLDVRKRQPEVGTGLMTAVKRLDQDEEVREWLMAQEQFVDPRLLARHGILLVTARLADSAGSQWARHQAVRSLLGLLAESGAAVILHGLKLDKQDRQLLRDMRFIVSHVPASTTIITRCQGELADRLARRFSPNGNGKPAITAEHLQLLSPRSAVVNSPDGDALVSWKSKI